jgi:hypothetical protein
MYKRWLSTVQAARALGISRQTLYNKCDRACHVDHYRRLILGEHWMPGIHGYLINVAHPCIKEVFNG